MNDLNFTGSYLWIIIIVIITFGFIVFKFFNIKINFQKTKGKKSPMTSGDNSPIIGNNSSFNDKKKQK